MPALSPTEMRVLITTDSVGGVWRYAMDVASGLKARGAEAAVAGMGPDPSAAQRDEAEREGVELFWLDAELDWMAEGPDSITEAAAAIDDVAAAWQPTILHLNAPPLAAHLRFPCATVVAAHSCISTWWRAMRGGLLPGDWQWHREATAEGLAAADAIIAPSAAFADALSDVYGPLPHLRVVWNGGRGVVSAAKRPNVLGAGRWWDDSKNLAALDRAARDCHWPVRIAGPLVGPNGTGARAENVEYLGDLLHERMQRLIGEASVFVSPSHYEPFGLAVLEAASAGAALVLSDIPTFRELWHGCALFVECDDAAGFARAINRLAQNEEERRQLANTAAGRALRYSLDAQIDGLLNVYAAAAHGRSAWRKGAA